MTTRQVSVLQTLAGSTCLTNRRYAFHVLTAKKLSKQTNAAAKSVQQPVDKTLRTFDTNHRVISILRSLLVEEAQEPHSPNGSTVLLVLSPFVMKKHAPTREPQWCFSMS